MSETTKIRVDATADTPTATLPADPRELPLSVPMTTAGHYLGMSQWLSYKEHGRGAFPIAVLKRGRKLMCLREDLLRALHVTH